MKKRALYGCCTDTYQIVVCLEMRHHYLTVALGAILCGLVSGQYDNTGGASYASSYSSNNGGQYSNAGSYAGTNNGGAYPQNYDQNSNPNAGSYASTNNGGAYPQNYDQNPNPNAGSNANANNGETYNQNSQQNGQNSNPNAGSYAYASSGGTYNQDASQNYGQNANTGQTAPSRAGTNFHPPMRRMHHPPRDMQKWRQFVERMHAMRLRAQQELANRGSAPQDGNNPQQFSMANPQASNGQQQQGGTDYQYSPSDYNANNGNIQQSQGNQAPPETDPSQQAQGEPQPNRPRLNENIMAQIRARLAAIRAHMQQPQAAYSQQTSGGNAQQYDTGGSQTSNANRQDYEYNNSPRGTDENQQQAADGNTEQSANGEQSSSASARAVANNEQSSAYSQQYDNSQQAADRSAQQPQRDSPQYSDDNQQSPAASSQAVANSQPSNVDSQQPDNNNNPKQPTDGNLPPSGGDSSQPPDVQDKSTSSSSHEKSISHQSKTKTSTTVIDFSFPDGFFSNIYEAHNAKKESTEVSGSGYTIMTTPMPMNSTETPESCRADEVWYNCKPQNHKTCYNYARSKSHEDRECEPGCWCKNGTVRAADGQCVDPDECEDPICEDNEEETDCMFPCNTCRYQCQECNEMVCYPSCGCYDGLVRNHHGKCIHVTECEPCTTTTEPSTDTTTTEAYTNSDVESSTESNAGSTAESSAGSVASSSSASSGASSSSGSSAVAESSASSSS